MQAKIRCSRTIVEQNTMMFAQISIDGCSIGDKRGDYASQSTNCT